jgi:hypothetical protein
VLIGSNEGMRYGHGRLRRPLRYGLLAVSSKKYEKCVILNGGSREGSSEVLQCVGQASRSQSSWREPYSKAKPLKPLVSASEPGDRQDPCSSNRRYRTSCIPKT